MVEYSFFLSFFWAQTSKTIDVGRNKSNATILTPTDSTTDFQKPLNLFCSIGISVDDRWFYSFLWLIFLCLCFCFNELNNYHLCLRTRTIVCSKFKCNVAVFELVLLNSFFLQSFWSGVGTHRESYVCVRERERKKNKGRMWM